MSFVVLITVTLTAIQYFTSSNFLGLLFPWRSSVYLVPICSMIVLTKLLIIAANKYLKSHSKLNLYTTVLTLFLIISLSMNGIFESYKSNKNYKNNYPISNLIKDHEKDISRILIPAKLKEIRLNTGLPIFVDWKSAPFKNDAVIEWYDRIKLSNSFFNISNYEDQKKLIIEINNKEQISHILIKDNDKNLVLKDCKYLFKQYGYLLYSLSECHNVM